MTARKAFLSAGGLFMLLVIMLGVIGVVNGLWSKNLVVDGVVSTGDLNADWDCGYTNDDGAVGTPGVIPGGGCANVVEPEGDDGLDPNNFDWPNFTDSSPFVFKDVGECNLTIGDPDTSSTGFGNQVANVTIKNAYPSYECTTTLFLSNTGSIPFNLISAELKLPAASEGILETVDASGTNQCDPATLLEDPQVDPGEELQFDCTVHVTQLAAQSECSGTTTGPPDHRVVAEDCTAAGLVSYDFAIDFCVAQWNEGTTATLCKTSEQHEGPGGVIRVQSPPLSFSSTGWGGWSCPAGTQVVGGGYEPGSATVAVSKAADPGDVTAPAYPTYPHYTYTPPETGWVVQNGGTPQVLTVFALCLPN